MAPIVIAGLIGLTWQAGALTAQTASWTNPASGYVFDPLNREIRSVSGYLGSATIGSAVITGIDWASLAPNRKSAFVQLNQAMTWVADLGNPDQIQSLATLPLAEQLIWASDSTQAVMLAPGGQLIWLTNFASSPSAGARWSLDTFGPGTRLAEGPHWVILAADATAGRVLLTVNTGERRQLWIASPTAPPALIPFSGLPAAAAFAFQSAAVFVADAASHQIDEIRGLDTTPTIAPLLTSATYVNAPAGLALSTDDSHLFIADRTTNLIRVIDTANGALVAALPADSVPQSVTAFAGGLFLLGSTPPAPFQFLDTSSSPRVVFVPRGE
jgi:hypothetical protein